MIERILTPPTLAPNQKQNQIDTISSPTKSILEHPLPPSPTKKDMTRSGADRSVDILGQSMQILDVSDKASIPSKRVTRSSVADKENNTDIRSTHQDYVVPTKGGSDSLLVSKPHSKQQRHAKEEEEDDDDDDEDEEEEVDEEEEEEEEEEKQDEELTELGKKSLRAINALRGLTLQEVELLRKPEIRRLATVCQICTCSVTMIIWLFWFYANMCFFRQTLLSTISAF